MNVSSLSLNRVFGFNNNITNSIHNVSSAEHKRLAYSVAHTVVIQDVNDGSQQLLRGHRYAVSAMASSADRQFLATSDQGPDPSLIIWDLTSGTALRSFFANSLPPFGLISLSFSSDSSILATLSAPSSSPQVLTLLDWMSSDSSSHIIASIDLPSSLGPFSHVQISPFDPSIIIVLGSSQVMSCLVTEGDEIDIKVSDCELDHSLFKIPIPNSPFLPSIVFLPPNSVGVFVVGITDGRGIIFSRDDSDIQSFMSMKAVQLHESSAITSCTQSNDLIYVATFNGQIRVFDYSFRLVAWFDDLMVSSIKTISLAPVTGLQFSFDEEKAEKKDYLQDADVPLQSFMIATSCGVVVNVEAVAIFGMIDPHCRRGQVVLQGFNGIVKTVSGHSTLPLAVTGDSSGVLRLFDLQSNLIIADKEYKEVINDVALRPTDDVMVLIGLGNGVISLVNLIDGHVNDVCFWNFSSPCITHLAWSPCGTYFACIDLDGVLSLFSHVNDPNYTLDDSQNRLFFERKNDWFLLGRHRIFTNTPTSLVFSIDRAQNYRLIATAKDGSIVEVDVIRSLFTRNKSSPLDLVLRARKLIEHMDHPTSIIFDCDDVITTDSDCLMVHNSDFKFKYLDSNNFEVFKTVQGPTFSSPVFKSLLFSDLNNEPINSKNRNTFMVFATEDRVIGTCLLPLDGNPARCLGVLGHSDSISDICVVNCKILNEIFVLSVGGSTVDTQSTVEGSLFVWKFDPQPLIQSVSTSGVGIKPFLTALDCDSEGGNSEFFDYLQNIFTVACIEGTDFNSYLAVEKLPEIFAALDCYLTQFEAKALINEANSLLQVKMAIAQNDDVTGIEFEDFVRLYFNHKRTRSWTEEDIGKALAVLSSDQNSREVPNRSELSRKIELPSINDVTISTDHLIGQLISRGEPFSSSKEFEDYLCSILDTELVDFLPDFLNLNDLMDLLALREE
ncbi:hypothetical protein RCL1_003920 [Eukaryota sp. TZLM3-RCL]